MFISNCFYSLNILLKVSSLSQTFDIYVNIWLFWSTVTIDTPAIAWYETETFL